MHNGSGVIAPFHFFISSESMGICEFPLDQCSPINKKTVYNRSFELTVINHAVKFHNWYKSLLETM